MDMPLETREEPNVTSDDPVALATRAVEEMRAASEQFRANAERRIAALETRLSRPAIIATTANPNEPTLHYRAWNSFLLRAPYAANGTWIMNRATIGYLRTLKASDGLYLWPSLFAPMSAGNPGTLLGRPVVEFPDMPNIGANNIAIAFGDFMSGFRIFDRVSLAVLRDPFSQATAGNVRFHARRRVGGQVTKPEALRLLKCGAA
jgi:predicted phage gp36 major capsid-like protein